MKVLALGAVIAVAALAAYWNSFSGAFVFDDAPSILDNPTIRDLSDLGAVLSPPADGRTVQGRPLLNLSLALNYALHGTDREGYHAVNLAIHVACALLLFGVVRRTLLLPSATAATSDCAAEVGFVVALAWVLHPLCTAAVTYVVQRCEALMAMLYLLALYALIRSAEPTGRPWWRALVVVACALAMASKEAAVTAPVVLLLFDRVYVSGSFRKGLREGWWMYLGLAATLGYLAWQLARAGSRGETLAYGGVSAWSTTAASQAVAVGTYLRLAFLPDSLVFDYGADPITDPRTTLPCVVFVAGLVVASLLLLWRRPRIGFPAFAFFLLLSPSSSVIPVVTQWMGEHRVYLPLAALVAFLIAGVCSYGGGGFVKWVIGLPLIILLGVLTHVRNGTYQSELSIWQDTAKKRPENARAHSNVGAMLMLAGKPEEALPHFQEALRRKPELVEALNGIGSCLNRLRSPEGALPYLQEAVRIDPKNASAHDNLGMSLEDLGRLPEAETQYREAIRLKPDSPKPHLNLGVLLAKQGRQPEAIAEFREALRLRPDYWAAHHNLGLSLDAIGEHEEAEAHFEEARRLLPRRR